MNHPGNFKLPKLFWIVAVAAVIWNLLGVIAYVMEVTMSEEAMAALPEAQQALYAAQPGWVMVAFAIAVFAGLAGSIALALRNSAATAIFIVSLIGITAQMFYTLVLSDMLAVMGPTSAILPSMIIVIAAALVWFSMRANAKDWIR